MNSERELDHLMESLFEAGPTQLSDRAYASVRAGIDGTRQRVAFRPWRTLDVNTFLKLAAGAAAVVVVAIVSASLLNAAPEPGIVPTPTPTFATSTPQAPAPQTPAPTVDARSDAVPLYGELSAGTYAFYNEVNGRTVRIDFRGATGWVARDWYITTSDQDATRQALASWGFGRIDVVYADPCDPGSTAIEIGDSVDDLVAALLAQQLRTSDPPINVSISGYAGKLIDSTVTFDSLAGCDSDQLLLWAGRGGASTRWIREPMAERLIILDVDGIRVLLLGAYPVGSSPDELLAIMSTLQVAVDPPAFAKDAGGLPPIGTNLGVGAYAFAKGTLDGRTIAVAFRNAEGWSSQGWYVSSPAGEVGQSTLAAWGLNGQPGPIGTVHGDPCQRGGTATIVAGGSEFLTNAILGQRHRTSEPPVEVSIGGYQGVLLESVIGAMDWSNCQGGHAEAWVSSTGTARWIGPNTRQRIYVLDVEGTTLVLEGTYPDGIARDQLFAMMDSIRIMVD